MRPGDVLNRLAHLGAAVAPLAAEDVAGEALAVQAHQRLAEGGAVGGAVQRAITQGERHMFTPIDEPGETDHPRFRGEAVGEAQRHHDGGPDLGGRWSSGHGIAPEVSWCANRSERA